MNIKRLVAALVLALGVIGWTWPVLATTYAYTFQRLQGNAQWSDEDTHLRAICDTGNGTMVYVVTGRDRATSAGIGVAIQPNGCGKLRVVAESPEKQ